MIHPADADVYARRSRGKQAGHVQQNHISRRGRMERVDKYHLVGVALIVCGLNDRRLRIHVKQDGRDRIVIR